MRGLTVSADGVLSLPAPYSTVTVGLPYSARGETLALASISGDGVHLGRRTLAGDVKFSLFNSLGLKVAGMTGPFIEVLRRDTTLDPVNGAMAPRTGTFDAPFDGSYRNDGKFKFAVDDPLPCTIRAVIIGATGEP